MNERGHVAARRTRLTKKAESENMASIRHEGSRIAISRREQNRMSQNPRFSVLLLMMVALIMLAVPLFAHHGTGVAYDSKKPTVVKGIVTDFAWRNPHAQLFLDVKDESGNTQQYAVEMNSPGVMTRQGWTKRQFKAGDEVSITVYPAKSGAPVGSCIGTCKVLINGKDATPTIAVEDR